MKSPASPFVNTNLVKIFIRGIAHLSEDDLYAFFSKVGRIKEIISRGKNGASKGFGFVEFRETTPELEKLLRKNIVIHGQNCWCDVAKPKISSQNELKMSYDYDYTKKPAEGQELDVMIRAYDEVCKQFEELAIKKDFLETMIAFKQKEVMPSRSPHPRARVEVTSPRAGASSHFSGERDDGFPPRICVSPRADGLTLESPMRMSPYLDKRSPWTPGPPKESPTLLTPQFEETRPPLWNARGRNLQAEFYLRRNASEFIPTKDSHDTRLQRE